MVFEFVSNIFSTSKVQKEMGEKTETIKIEKSEKRNNGAEKLEKGKRFGRSSTMVEFATLREPHSLPERYGQEGRPPLSPYEKILDDIPHASRSELWASVVSRSAQFQPQSSTSEASSSSEFSLGGPARPVGPSETYRKLLASIGRLEREASLSISNVIRETIANQIESDFEYDQIETTGTTGDDTSRSSSGFANKTWAKHTTRLPHVRSCEDLSEAALGHTRAAPGVLPFNSSFVGSRSTNFLSDRAHHHQTCSTSGDVDQIAHTRPTRSRSVSCLFGKDATPVVMDAEFKTLLESVSGFSGSSNGHEGSPYGALDQDFKNVRRHVAHTDDAHAMSLAGHRLLTELERSRRSKEPGFWLGEEALERHQETCKISDLVLKDVSRTFPKHSMYLTYDGQVKLWRLLMVYSLFDREVGYCQGLGFVAGMLLMYLSEENSFHVLKNLMYDRGMGLIYAPGLETLHDLMDVLEYQILCRMPRLAEHLGAFDMRAVLYAPAWVLTVFSAEFPSEFAERVMDLVLVAEKPLELMLQVAVAIVECSSEVLLQFDMMEDQLIYLKKTVTTWSKDRLDAVILMAMTIQIKLPKPRTPHGDPVVTRIKDTTSSYVRNIASPQNGRGKSLPPDSMLHYLSLTRSLVKPARRSFCRPSASRKSVESMDLSVDSNVETNGHEDGLADEDEYEDEFEENDMPAFNPGGQGNSSQMRMTRSMNNADMLLAESILAKRRQNEFRSSSDIKSTASHRHASDSHPWYDLRSSRPEDAPASVGVSSKEVSQWS